MNYLILQAAPQGGGSMQFLFTMGLMFLVLYFLIFRPQRKKQKQHQAMIDNLKINDKIITTGGMIGKIVNIKKDKNILVVRVDETNNTKIEFQRNAVSGVINEEVKG